MSEWDMGFWSGVLVCILADGLWHFIYRGILTDRDES